MKLLIVSQFILYFVTNLNLTIASTGSPEWDSLLAETSHIEPIRKSDDLHSYLDSFPPIPAFEHTIDPSTLSTTKQSVKKTKRILRQDPKNVARRLKYAESVKGLTKEQKPWQTAKYKESKEFRTGRRKFLRANLKLPGNEEKLRKSLADRAVYNKNYRTRIAQEIANGTISKERKETIEKAKQRKRLRNMARNRKRKGPGSPDWDALLASPIAENLSVSNSPRSSDRQHNQSIIPVEEEGESVQSRFHHIFNGQDSTRHQAIHSPQWYSIRQRELGTSNSAIFRRKRKARLTEEENIEALKSEQRKQVKSNQKWRQSLKGEAKMHFEEVSKRSQRRYEARRQESFKLPENTEKAKQFRARKAKNQQNWRKGFMDSIHSGNPTPEQMQKYIQFKKKRAETAKRAYHRKKAQRQANINQSENKNDQPTPP